MKKLSLLPLFVIQLLSAQSYNLYHHNDGNNNFKNIILSLTIMIIVFSTIFYLIAIFEGRNKNEDYTTKLINYEIWACLIIFILIVSALLYLLYASNVNPYLLVIPVKIVVTSFVSYYAKKKNRNPLLWWILGFLEYHSALIILAISKGLLPLKKGKSDEDIAYNEKLIKLNDLHKEGLINDDEIEKKKNTLENDYFKNSNLVQKNNEQKEQNDFIIKLEQAYKQGFLTEKEYQDKLLKYKPIEIENDFDEEKEKFRRFHLEGMITFEELKSKLAQIDKNRNSLNE